MTEEPKTDETKDQNDSVAAYEAEQKKEQEELETERLAINAIVDELEALARASKDSHIALIERRKAYGDKCIELELDRTAWRADAAKEANALLATQQHVQREIDEKMGERFGEYVARKEAYEKRLERRARAGWSLGWMGALIGMGPLLMAAMARKVVGKAGTASEAAPVEPPPDPQQGGSP